jgi:hypothetical protein
LLIAHTIGSTTPSNDQSHDQVFEHGRLPLRYSWLVLAEVLAMVTGRSLLGIATHE